VSVVFLKGLLVGGLNPFSLMISDRRRWQRMGGS